VRTDKIFERSRKMKNTKVPDKIIEELKNKILESMRGNYLVEVPYNTSFVFFVDSSEENPEIEVMELFQNE